VSVNKLPAHLLHILYNDIKGKDVPVNTLKAYVGKELYLHSFLTSVLDAGEWSASHLNHFNALPKTYTGAPEIRGWVGHRLGLDFWRREKYF